MSTEIETPLVFAISASLNDFAFDLHRRLRRRDENLIFSPAGIASALAMPYFGAAGRTRSELYELLHLTLAEPLLLRAFGSLNAFLGADGGNPQLSVANRLWGDSKLTLRPDFQALTRERFGAELARLDFSDPNAARHVINNWAAKKTKQRIPELIGPGLLDPLTRLVLTNAVYFRGQWRDEFRKEATCDLPFHRSSRQPVNVPTMHREGKYRYAESEDVQVLTLPYCGPRSLVILLPRSTDGLGAIEDRLTADEAKQAVFGGHERTVRVWLPRFRIASGLRLADALRSLGAQTSFTAQADFSGIAEPSDEPPLALSEFVHEAFIDVNEEGTEAAAATAGMLRAGYGGGPRLGPVDFRADRPFLFFIRDTTTGVILFLGRVTDPPTTECG